MRYFKGNTSARNKRIAKIHKKFKAHQRRWTFNRFARRMIPQR